MSTFKLDPNCNNPSLSGEPSSTPSKFKTTEDCTDRGLKSDPCPPSGGECDIDHDLLLEIKNEIIRIKACCN